MKPEKWWLIGAILYLGRNFFKCLFWFILFWIFYGLKILLD